MPLIQTSRIESTNDGDGVDTLTLATAPIAGNILVASAVARRNDMALVVPAWTDATVQTGATSWTLIQQRYTAVDDTAAGHRGALFWRVAAASEGSTVTFTSGGANTDTVFEVFEFSHSFSTPALSAASSGFMVLGPVADSDSVSTGSTGVAESSPVLWLALASIRNGFAMSTAVFSPAVNEAGYTNSGSSGNEFGWLESATTVAQDWTWTVSHSVTSGRFAMINGIVENSTPVGFTGSSFRIFSGSKALARISSGLASSIRLFDGTRLHGGA